MNTTYLTFSKQREHLFNVRFFISSSSSSPPKLVAEGHCGKRK
jgi:hypothetical protein